MSTFGFRPSSSTNSIENRLTLNHIDNKENISKSSFNNGNSLFVLSNSKDEIQQMVEEAKGREERLKKQLEMLREQALAAASRPSIFESERDAMETSQLKDQLDKYKSELTSVKDTMENILHFTKQTHDDVQRTKNMVSSIHELTPNKGYFDEQENLDEPYLTIEKSGCDEQMSEEEEFDDENEIAFTIK